MIISVIIKISQFGKRLDQALSTLLPHYSRTLIKRWIISGKVKINGQKIVIPKKKVVGGELIEIESVADINYVIQPQNIPLNIVYEDEDIFVINKSSNMVVHPGAGNYSGTLLNGLLYRCASIIRVPRAGIVQRLDKDTTGLMVVAKNVAAYNYLLQLFKERRIIREYEAIVFGVFNCDIGTIDKPIQRHITVRTRMAVGLTGKSAITHYNVIEKFNKHTRVYVRLETGRTHQIRVHMEYIHHPVVGDRKYGGKFISFVKDASNELNNCLHFFSRQALHSRMLQLYHPSSRILMKWIIPLPEDMMNLIDVLRKNEFINK